MHSFFEKLSRLFAILGGLVLTVLIVMVCLSVLGRSLNSVLNGDFLQSFMPGLADALLATGIGPINGDFELVEAGMAFTVFAFLPICQIYDAHASVDIFTARLSRGVNRFLSMVIEIVFALVLIIIANQLFLGAMNKFNSGETTLLLQFPLWWAYAASVIAAAVAALVASYTAVMRVVEFATATTRLPSEAGEGH